MAAKSTVKTGLRCCQLLNLWIFQMLPLSSQPNPVLPQNKHDTTNLRTIEHNLAYGCHTEVAWLNLLIFTRGGDYLQTRGTSSMRFIDPNRDTNIVHKSPMRVNEIHTPVLFKVWSTTGLGHTYKYSTSLKPSGQCFNRRPLMISWESTYPNPSIGQLTELKDVYWQFWEIVKASLLIFINGGTTSNFNTLLSFN